MSDISTLISYLNSSGGIPLKITSTVATSSGQFLLNTGVTLLGSLFVVYIFFGMFKEQIFTSMIKLKLRRIAIRTGRNVLLIKHTRQDLFNMSMIDQNTLMKVSKAMQEFGGKPFDLFIHSPGGDVFASFFISRLFKEYPGQIRTFVPIYSMSGGTILALSGDEIYMNSTSCLGPVDPQLGNLFKFGSAKQWDYIMKKKGTKAEDSTFSMALMGRQYTKSIANHVDDLLDGKMSQKNKGNFVRFLTSGEVEHAYNLTANQLIKLGLKINNIPEDINRFITKLIISKSGEGVSFFKIKN